MQIQRLLKILSIRIVVQALASMCVAWESSKASEREGKCVCSLHSWNNWIQA